MKTSAFIAMGFTLSLILICSCDTERSLGPEDKNFFVKYYGSEGSQEGVDFLVNESDRSLILLGTSFVGQSSRLLVIKTDWEGNVIWKKHLGGPTDLARDIEFSNDGGYVVLAQTQGVSADDADLKLIKINTDGIKLDSVVYGLVENDGSLANEYPKTVTAMGATYVVTGSTDIDTVRADLSLPVSDVLHVQFNENLDFDNQFKTYSSNSQTEFGIRTVKLDVGVNYVFGTSFKSSSSTGTNDDFNFWLFPVNDFGDFSGQDALFGNDNAGHDEILSAVCPAFPNGYLLAGTYTNGPNSKDIFIARVIQDGNALKKSQDGIRIVVSRAGGEARKLMPVSVAPSIIDGPGYLILSNEEDNDVRNIWLTKVSDSGSDLWSASFGALGGNDDTAGAVAELPDGRIIVLGTVNLGDENIRKMALFKLNRNGKFAN